MKKLLLFGLVVLLICTAVFIPLCRYHQSQLSKLQTELEFQRVSNIRAMELKDANILWLWSEKERLQAKAEEVWGSPSLRDFENINELLSFLGDVRVNYNQWRMPEYVCTDFSIDLMKIAAESGYRLYPMTISDFWGLHMCNAAFTTVPYEGEMIKVVIGVEPQFLEVWLVGRILHDRIEEWEDGALETMVRLKGENKKEE